MTKHIHEIGRQNATNAVNAIFPGDYEIDTAVSKTAGYDVYRSTDRENHYYNYICDLGNRFEINLESGDTVNVWIDEMPEAEAPTESEMHEYTLTIGLFDKDTEKQEISTEAAKRIISEMLLNKYDIFAFTMIDCNGVYKMNSTGRIVSEPSIRIEIATDEAMPDTVNAIIDELKNREHLNQESIMMKHSIEKISFR